jgi:hypothetical protein
MMTYKPSAEQNVVRVLENSVLVIEKLTTTDTGADTVSDTELNLKKGGIFASVKKLSAAAQYIVKTPTGIAGVRGTQFELVLNDDGSVKMCAVYKTTNADGGLVIVTAPGDPGTNLVGGQMLENGNPTPIPSGLMGALQMLSSAVRTIYIEVINYDYDRTKIIESKDISG